MARVRVALGLVVAGLVLAGSAWAASGTVTHLPAHASPEGVEAINAKGVIGGVGSLSTSGSYKLKLAAGTRIVVASAQSGDQPLTALASPVRVRSRRPSHARPAGAKVQATAAAVRRLRPGSVVSIDPIELEDERDFLNAPSFPNADYTATVTNDLFGRCAAHGITFVDTSDTFHRFAKQESNLSRAGRLSNTGPSRPSTRSRATPGTSSGRLAA